VQPLLRANRARPTSRPVLALCAAKLSIVALALLGACAGDDDASSAYPAGNTWASASGTPAASAGAEPCAVVEACSLLGQDEVSEAVGSAMRAGEEDPGTGGAAGEASGGDGAVRTSMCIYGSQHSVPPEGVGLMLWCSPSGGADPDEVRKTLVASGFTTPTPVAAPGDEALWSTRSTGKTVTGQLAVFDGDTFMLVVQVTSHLGEGDARKAAVAMAQKAMARLGR
jgi:hypothetical protein